ncbi:hypothetical protein QBC39DRAFT_58029 [Podospora conica]|nr:hypothetical protein QBC39DRAFT_58029 [Schizothecium conicum]
MTNPCPCPDLEPDPDIAGIGVLLAFILLSTLTLLASLFHLVLVESDHRRDPKHTVYSPFDRRARDLVARFSPHPVLRKTLFDLVLSLSDTQLVTGTAVLLATIIRLHSASSDVSVYHFSMAQNLGWLSSNAQLVGMLTVRVESVGSLKEGRRRKYVPVRSKGFWGEVMTSLRRWGDVKLRVVLMLVLAGLLLLYCSWVSGWEEWDAEYDCPARCALGEKKGGEPWRWMVVDFVLVVWTYVTRAFVLFSRRWQVWWLGKVRHLVVDEEARAQTTKGWRKVTRWVWYLFASELLDILMIMIWFCLGITWIGMDLADVRTWAPEVRAKEENVEGFGQLVPLVLVVLPLFQVLQSYCAQERETRNDETT